MEAHEREIMAPITLKANEESSVSRSIFQSFTYQEHWDKCNVYFTVKLMGILRIFSVDG